MRKKERATERNAENRVCQREMGRNRKKKEREREGDGEKSRKQSDFGHPTILPHE